MTKKIVFGAALALVFVGVAASNASASCNPPKRASTYNSLTGAYTYWTTTIPSAGATLVGKLWSGSTDLTGTCNASPGILYFAPGGVGMNMDLGNACFPGTLCPGASLSVMAAVTDGTNTEFLTTQAPEIPSGGVNYDFSTLGHPMVALPRPRAMNSSRGGTNVTLSIAVSAITDGLYDGSASEITGYNIRSQSSSSDPGRSAAAYTGPVTPLAAVGGAAGAGTVVVDCSNALSDQWLVTQIVTAAGPSEAVSAPIRVNCNPALADPKYKIVPKKAPPLRTVPDSNPN